ncbi:MAG TPA: glycosyltransferase [Candidatus Eisenbacteria bacterium]
MKGRSALRIMVYSQDGFGLGHLRRNLNIAIQVQRQVPHSVILIVADSPAAPFFRLPPRCDFVKIPTLVKVNTGVWSSDRLRLVNEELLAIRSEIMEDVATGFRPHLVLVDHMPNGVAGELTKPLQTLREHARRAKIVLGLRDILGARADICKQWLADGAYEAAEAYYDRILVYGCAELFDLAAEYQFSADLVAKTIYCGYVSREHIPPAGPTSRPPERPPFVLVTGGGGADSSFFMDRFLDALRLVGSETRCRAILAVGPFLHREQYRLLARKARGLPVRLSRLGQDGIRLLRRADVVISMAGYNTISEVMRFRKKAIVIPRPGPSAEQTMRTSVLAARGLFEVIHPHHLTPETLAAALAERISATSMVDERDLPPLNGASRAAAQMLAEVRA